MKSLFGLLLFAAFLAVLVATLSSCAEAISKNRGISAPAFSLPDLDGNIHELADYNGHKVYLYFWSSWCSICLAGMSGLQELSKNGEEFTVLTIVSPNAYAEKDARAFMLWFNEFEHNTEITVLLDEGGEVYESYAINGYPSSIFIGSDGKLAQKHTGHLQNTEIIESMNSIH